MNDLIDDRNRHLYFQESKIFQRIVNQLLDNKNNSSRIDCTVSHWNLSHYFLDTPGIKRYSEERKKKKKEIYIDILQNTNRYCRYIAITANWSGVHVARLGLGCKMCLEYSAIENISAICEVSVIIFTDTFQ